MNDSDFKIVRITNIANFDFTGELGARYGGRDFFVPAGGSLLAPLTVGDHLATHLARQIILKKAPIRGESELNGKGSERPLWDDESINKLKAMIMVEAYEEAKPKTMSEAERLAAKVVELNKMAGDIDSKSNDPGSYQDKAEVISELQKRGIKYDARASKSVLEELLK